MALPNSTYPIGQYLLRLLKESELPLGVFCIQELAYSDPQEGIQDFLNAVKCGRCSEQINRRLAEYTQSPIELENALRRNDQYLEAETERIIADETEKERRLFVPHIHADFCFVAPCRKRPDASFGGSPSTPVITIPPEISKLQKEQQLPLLKPLIQEHFARYGDLITEYGERIDGYRSWLSLEDWDEAEFHLFDIEGNFIPDEPATWPKPRPRKAERIKPVDHNKRATNKPRRSRT